MGSICFVRACEVSIHAPREGCDEIAVLPSKSSRLVSIHAPREGCDVSEANICSVVTIVSIHAPREGCDDTSYRYRKIGGEFQFTHPGRGATVWCKVAYYRADKQA